jgi:hypothetical protein
VPKPISVTPVNPGRTGGFKPTGLAPRGNDGDGNSGGPRRVNNGGPQRDFPANDAVPAGVTRRVSDRVSRFSVVNAAAPASSGSCGTSWDDDHHDYWDGYRDGYRHGYRHGYWDGRWDDCWYPRHRHGWGGWGWGFGGSWWNGCSSGWSISIGFGSGYYGGGWWRSGWCSTPVYYAPVYTTYVVPSYSSVVTYTSTDWFGSTTVSTTYYSNTPRCDVVDFCDAIVAPATIVYAAPTERVVNVDLPDFQPTVYQSDELAGVLGWSDTPEAVVGTVGSASATERPQAASQFLGRVPAGGWDVGYEGDRVEDGRRVLLFRGLTPNPRGQRVLIIMEPKGPVQTLHAGQRLQITGRVSAICVDDPFEQAGIITLAEGLVKY